MKLTDKLTKSIALAGLVTALSSDPSYALNAGHSYDSTSKSESNKEPNNHDGYLALGLLGLFAIGAYKCINFDKQISELKEEKN